MAFNFTLPGLRNRKAAVGKEPVTRAEPQLADDARIRPAGLGSVRLQLLAASVVLPTALALFIFQLMSYHITRVIEHETSIATEQMAARVAAMVDYYAGSVSQLATDPEIAALLKTGTEAALREREKELQYVFPDAIGVRLLPPGLEEVDMQASPPLSYAALSQMRMAEKGRRLPPVEVHLLDTPRQHVNVVRSVADPGGNGVVGHVMLSLSRDVLQGILGDPQRVSGYFELQQAGIEGEPAVVATHGDKRARDGSPGRVLPVTGSRLQVAYWPAVTSLGYLGGVSLWVLGALLVTVALLAFLIVFLFRRLLGALHVDQTTLVTLLKDFFAGKARRDYPSGLTEMRETIEYLIQLAANTRQKEKQSGRAPREQDLEYTSGQAAGPDAPMAADTGKPAAPDYQEGVAADFRSGIRSDNLILEEEPLDAQPEDAEVGIDPSIFRAYDIRGIVDRTLDAGVVEQIGRAIGSEALQCGRNTVVVGRDGRLSGPKLTAALIDGITATGCDVRDIGRVPTPVLYFATHHLDTRSGVVVTGSHNPPDYNGMKIVIDGETLAGEAIQHLRQRIESGNFISGSGSVETIDVVPDYIGRIRADVDVVRPLKVVVDCGNGVAGGLAPQLFRELGCEVTELFCEVDGNFPNHHPDPSKTDNLKDLIDAVRTGGADIGFAFDGDGDRLGVVTADGRIIWPDRVLMLFAADILDRNPGGKIIYDVKCSRHLDAIIREHGGEPVMWKTGHSFIKAKIKESGALLAGEMSGHIFIKERWYGFDDALYAGARLLEILARDERPVTEVFASLPDSVNTPELNVSMREGEPPAFIERLLEKAHFEGARVSTIDGLRADFEDGWGLVRASNTTPVLVLRFEAENNAALMRIMKEFRQVMLQIDPQLSLPF
jgi:phosphomannomutase/phosphoglucomutase